MKNWSKDKKEGTIVRKAICIFVALLLILSAVPPISLGLMNIYILIPVLLGVLLLFLPALLRQGDRLPVKTRKRILRCLLSILILIAVGAGTVLALILTGETRDDAPPNTPVIVLGAQVKGSSPSLVLLGRIRAAARYLNENPDAICIASGGKGGDEEISEAACIANTLVSSYAIDPSRIRIEDKSTDTFENLKNSYSLMQKDQLGTTAVILSDAFHLYRAKTIARHIGLTAYGYPCNTDWRLVFYLHIREIIAVPKTYFLDLN